MNDIKPLIVERTLHAPVAKVWQALTDIAQLKQWQPFFPDFKAEVGFKVEFDLGPDDEHQYHHVVEVLEVIPQQKLTYSWDYGGMNPGSSTTFELYPEGDVTRLVLTARFATAPTAYPDFMKNATFGWNFTADGLQKLVEASN